MNKLYITKVLPDGYGVGVIPEMEMPSVYRFCGSVKKNWQDCNEYEQHLASLPTFLIHPSFNPKEGEWIENYTEGYEWKHGDGWRVCSSGDYYKTVEKNRRIVLLPLVEKAIDYNSNSLMTGRTVFINPALSASPPPEGNTPASANFIQVIPDSHSWSSIEMLLHFLEHYKNGDISANYLIIGLQNTKNNGYQLSQSPPSLQEREKGIKWVKASERLPENRKIVVVKVKTENEIILHCDGFIDNSFGKGESWFLGTPGTNFPVKYTNNVIEWLDESQDTAKQSK